ncbi:MAG: FAD-dependent oxidoreductase, partial [Alphaproteobacteria bacterium]|nr:FAD-dependent oxidoreductase [Alphaproteobacteria bacterium]
MVELVKADLCVIGAGAGGLSVAAGAAQMGASVVLFEGGQMGGDCLNHGCVPSKALLAAGKVMSRQRGDTKYGIISEPGKVDFDAVKAHVQGVIDGIAPMDSVERFEGFGVRVIEASARFTGSRTVEGGGVQVTARRIIVATGSTPLVPPVPGLAEGPYLTNETIFGLDAFPEHLLVMGGGPIGIELAQAFRNLGASVTVVEMAKIMAKDDSELVDLLRQRLARDGVEIHEGTQVKHVAYPDSGGVIVTVAEGDAEREIQASHILVAAGRQATMAGLDLETAGIASTPKGITVDSGLRTSN